MFDPQTFIIPDNTTIEDRTIVVDGGAIIGGNSSIEYGIIARNVVIGEHVEICGEISARSDIYIDRWSDIRGAVRADGDAHLGEFVNIHGKLIVDGDLDIGDHVSIEDGFEANGWIMIRNPIPVIIFLYLYLSELLRLGKDEEVEKALQELFADDPEEIDAQTMVVPGKSMISLSTIELDHPIDIGNNCRLQGNIRAESLFMGNGTTLFGSIRVKDAIIHENNVIHGNIDAKGSVHIGEGSHILGDLYARMINIHRSAVVDGTMNAPHGIVIEEAENPDETESKRPGLPKTEIKRKKKDRRVRLSRSGRRSGKTHNKSRKRTAGSVLHGRRHERR